MLQSLGADTGGIGSLAEALDTYWDEIEADFDRFYNRDLRIAIRHLGLRRLWVRIKNLPADSAFITVFLHEHGEGGGGGQGQAAPARAQRTDDPNHIAAFLGMGTRGMGDGMEMRADRAVKRPKGGKKGPKKGTSGG